MRTAASLSAMLLLAGAARAAILPTFDRGDCNEHATHVLVVNKAGEVIDVWRGDCKVGTRLPLEEFKIKPEHDLRSPFERTATGRVTGNRIVLFLTTSGPKYGRGLVVQGWAAANWQADFNASAVWVEDGKTYALTQIFNPGNLFMAPHRPEDTEAKLKEKVETLNMDVWLFLHQARAEPNLAKRANFLAEVVIDYPGFATAVFAEMTKCGADALPAIRTIIYPDPLEKPRGTRVLATASSIGYPATAAAYRTLASIGEPGCADLVRCLKEKLAGWKGNSNRLRWYPRFEEDDKPGYEFLLALTSNPAAFARMTDAERAVVAEFRSFWAGHPFLSTLGKEGDRIQDRLDRGLAAGTK
jgi:hypothetical protein